jgi:hypothetical protein
LTVISSVPTATATPTKIAHPISGSTLKRYTLEPAHSLREEERRDSDQSP